MTRIVLKTSPELRRRTPWRPTKVRCSLAGSTCIFRVDGTCERCELPALKLPTVGVLPSAALMVRI